MCCQARRASFTPGTRHFNVTDDDKKAHRKKKKKIHRDRKDSTTLTCAKSLLACYCSSSVTTAPRFFVAVHNPLEPRETSGATVTTRTLTEYTHGTMVVTKETNHFPTIRSIAFGHWGDANGAGETREMRFPWFLQDFIYLKKIAFLWDLHLLERFGWSFGVLCSTLVNRVSELKDLVSSF